MAKPIRTFVPARLESIREQLAGKSTGQNVFEGRRGIGPLAESMPAQNLIQSFDADGDRLLSKEEFTRGFGKWFDMWDVAKAGQLNEDQIRSGVSQSMQLPRPRRGILGVF